MDKNLMNLLQTVGALRLAESTDGDGGGTATSSDDDAGDSANDPQDEPLGEKGLKALRSERQRAAEAKKRAEAAEARLKEIEDAEKSELQRAQERIAELEKVTKTYEEENTRAKLRAEVLSLKNVPSEWADFVTGDTEDEMIKAADRILSNLSHADKGPTLRPTSGQPGGSLEAGYEAAKHFHP